MIRFLSILGSLISLTSSQFLPNDDFDQDLLGLDDDLSHYPSFKKVLISNGIDGPGSRLYLHYHPHGNSTDDQARTREACQLSLEVEYHVPKQGIVKKKTILSTLNNGQFLFTGLGNITSIKILDNGNIAEYPSIEYISDN